MKICYLKIRNFKSIRELEIKNVESAMILVGKNNTGKTAVIDALLLAAGMRIIKPYEYLDSTCTVEIKLQIAYTESDLNYFHSKGIISKAHDYEEWLKEFETSLPSFQDGIISFTCLIDPDQSIRYEDGFQENNPFIVDIFPKIYHIDQNRNLEALQNDVFSFYDKESFQMLKDNLCTFDSTRTCNLCFE